MLGVLSSKVLLSILHTQKSIDNTFVGSNVFMGSPNVFGGQFVAQALNAAFQTVEEGKLCNSLHCYFLLPGNLQKAIDFEVKVLRDGNSFSTRNVSGWQNGKRLFEMMVSFQSKELGFFHQIQMPIVPEPETLEEILHLPDIKDEYALSVMKKFLLTEKPIEMRICPPDKTQNNYSRQVWFRFKDIPSDVSLVDGQQLIAYASDYNILATALLVHGNVANFTNTQVASLDHDIRFYHPCQYDNWLLFDIESPIALDARGFATGRIFNRNGELVAIVSQEGIMRPTAGLIDN